MKALLVLLALAGAACSLPAATGGIDILDPWVRAVPPVSSSTAVFMVIRNSGSATAVLLSAQSPLAKNAKPMVTTRGPNGLLGMEFVRSFSIPAGEKRILEPGGDHIMLLELKSVPKAGSTVPLTLVFEADAKRQEIRVEAPVR